MKEGKIVIPAFVNKELSDHFDIEDKNCFLFLKWLLKQHRYCKYLWMFHEKLFIRFLRNKKDIGWFTLRTQNNCLHLDMIVIADRGHGHFRKQMLLLTKFSREMKIPITLNSCAMHDTDQHELDNFYKSIGFKQSDLLIYEVLEETKKGHSI